MKTESPHTVTAGPCTGAGRPRIHCVSRLLPLLLLLGLAGWAQAQFEYTVDEGTVTITKYTGPGGDVVIPDTIDGFPVTRIGRSAFRGSKGLTSLAIPDSVTSIDSGAFTGCAGLRSIVVPSGVTRIDRDVFYSCTSLTSVTIPESVTSIGNFAFGDCTSLKRITIPKSVSAIENGAFAYCSSLTTAQFEGDAPILEWVTSPGTSWFPFPFEGAPTTVYYLPGTSGWGSDFWGSPTRPWGVVWGSEVRGDVDGDNDVDRDDLAMVAAWRNHWALDSEDPRDLDGDGMITVLDARILVTLFAVPGGFTRLESGPEGMVLEWNDGGGVLKLQSTTDLQREPWQDVEDLPPSTPTLISRTAERGFFRLVPVE